LHTIREKAVDNEEACGGTTKVSLKGREYLVVRGLVECLRKIHCQEANIAIVLS
jgi:hypothetical protein